MAPHYYGYNLHASATNLIVLIYDNIIEGNEGNKLDYFSLTFLYVLRSGAGRLKKLKFNYYKPSFITSKSHY
jgi:hypothetical protein